MRFSTLAVTLFIVLAPAAALAGDATCAWRALPEATRSSVISVYEDKQVSGIGEFLTAEMMEDALAKCTLR